MLRVSHCMRLLADAERCGAMPPPRASSPTGPVVIWNLIRRCNLSCKHCYSLSADHDYAGELSTAEAFTVGQAKLLFDALTCPKDYLLFTEEDTAQLHCQEAAQAVANHRMFDWVDEYI